jgi:hypothetical protein
MIKFDGIYVKTPRPYTDWAGGNRFDGFLCAAFLFLEEGLCLHSVKNSIMSDVEFNRQDFSYNSSYPYEFFEDHVLVQFYPNSPYSRKNIFRFEGEDVLSCSEIIEIDGSITRPEPYQLSFQRWAVSP